MQYIVHVSWVVHDNPRSAGLAFDSSDADLLHNAGVAVWNFGRAEEAKRLFRRALKINPRDARPHNNLGVIR